jgi:hypothetical protein
MLFNSSWDRHWRRDGTVTDLKNGEIMIFAFKDDDEWYAVGDAVLLYNGIAEDHYACKLAANDEWKCCYHFTNFRLYSKRVSYDEMAEKLEDFIPNRNKVVYLIPDNYVHLLSLTATV